MLPRFSKRLSVRALLSLSVLALSLSTLACEDGSTGPTDGGRSVYAVDANNRLIRFGAATPNDVTRDVQITGLQGGETILGIDFRAMASPDDRLYALGSTRRIYTIDTLTGVATVVSNTQFAGILAGTSFGFDFNPTVDRIRVHGLEAGLNLRLNPITGATAGTDEVLSYAMADIAAGATPRIAGTAYTNSSPGAPSTALFAIDSDRDVLVVLATPNDGIISSRGALNVNTTNSVGFDIVGDPGLGFATLNTGASGPSGFYSINLSTGAAVRIGLVGHSTTLVAMAVVQNDD